MKSASDYAGSTGLNFDLMNLRPIYPDYEARAKEAMQKVRKERHIQRVAEHLAWAAPEKLEYSCQDAESLLNYLDPLRDPDKNIYG